MRRVLPGLLLLLTGAALLRVSLLSDLYLRYVKEGMRPALIAAGAVLVLLGALAAVRDSLPRTGQEHGDEHRREHRHGHSDEQGDGHRQEHGHGRGRGDEQGDGHRQEHGHGHEDRDGDGHRRGDEDSDGHGHRHHGPRLAWLLALPAAMLLLFAPPALGSYTVARDGSGAIAKRASFSALPAGDPLPLTLSEFSSRAVWDPAESLKGRTVRLSGFATPVDGQSWQLSRIIVSCCAADARVVKVEVHGVPAPAANAWVSVTGVWRPGTRVPALDAASVTPIPTPDHPYKDVALP